MPAVATLTSPGVDIVVGQEHLASVRIFVNPDGNGAVEVPPGPLTIVEVPGTALGVLATLKAKGPGFTIHVVGNGSLAKFMALAA
jgi:hypothetical protein